MNEITMYQLESMCYWAQERESLAKQITGAFKQETLDMEKEDLDELFFEYDNSCEVLNGMERDVGVKVERSEDVQEASIIYRTYIKIKD